ncbi:MAG: DUF922 domain-containing protein, partial [Pseudomonadota bacterium]
MRGRTTDRPNQRAQVAFLPAVHAYTCALATLFLLATPAAAEVAYTETRGSYDLPGSIASKRDLNEAITRYGPHARGSSAVGTARSSYRWSSRTVRAGGRCTLARLTVHLDVHLTLPRWRSAYAASQPMQNTYRCVKSVVTVHEKRHAEIALATARDIERITLERMVDVPCARFNKTMRSVVEDVLADGARRQRRFDAADYQRDRYSKCFRDASAANFRPPRGLTREVAVPAAEQAVERLIATRAKLLLRAEAQGTAQTGSSLERARTPGARIRTAQARGELESGEGVETDTENAPAFWLWLAVLIAVIAGLLSLAFAALTRAAEEHGGDAMPTQANDPAGSSEAH